jgi:hypothetical protein
MSHSFAMLNQQALIAAADAIRSDDHKMIEALGLEDIPERVALKLKNMTMSDIAYAREFRGQIMSIRIDPSIAELYLDFASNKAREDDLITAAIMGGIRQSHLEQIKGVSRRDYEARRKRLGLSEHPRGRVYTLSEDDELRVLKTWQELEPIEDLLARYVELYNRTQIRIDSAWITVNQFAG